MRACEDVGVEECGCVYSVMPSCLTLESITALIQGGYLGEGESPEISCPQCKRVVAGAFDPPLARRALAKVRKLVALKVT